MEDALIQISFVEKIWSGQFFFRHFHVKLKRHSVWFSDKKPAILYVNTTDPIFHACGFTWNFRWVCLPCYAASHIQHVQYTILAIIHRHPLFFFVSYIHFAHSILFALLFHIHFDAFHVIEFTKLATSNVVSLWIWYNLTRAYVTYTHRIHTSIEINRWFLFPVNDRTISRLFKSDHLEFFPN